MDELERLERNRLVEALTQAFDNNDNFSVTLELFNYKKLDSKSIMALYIYLLETSSEQPRVTLISAINRGFIG